MTLTKQDIDALVDGMPEAECNPERVTFDAHTYVRRDLLRSSLYLAAGLTATGERKPERVRCWLCRTPDHAPFVSLFSPLDLHPGAKEITPGWFVPDGAE